MTIEVTYTTRQVPKLWYLIYRFIANDLKPEYKDLALRTFTQAQNVTLFLLTTSRGHILLLNMNYGMYRVGARTALYKAAKAFFYEHPNRPVRLNIIKRGRDGDF